MVEAALSGREGIALFRQANIWVPLRGGARAYPLRGAPIDFLGAVRGVPVAIECKEVGRGRRLSLNSSRIPEKEVAALKRFEDAGGCSFVVIAFWELGSLELVSFPEFYSRWFEYRRGGKASLLFGECGVVIPFTGFAVLPDVFLRLLENRSRKTY